MERIILGFLILLSTFSAHTEVFNSDNYGWTIFNGEKNVIIDGNVLKLTFNDENFSGSSEIFSDDNETIVLTFKRVILLNYLSEQSLGQDSKVSIITNSLQECEKIKDILKAEESSDSNVSDLRLRSINYSIPETTINTVNPQQISMRCHIDFVGEVDRK